MGEKRKRPCFLKKGGGRDMTTYQIINLGTSLDAGMKSPA